MSVHTGTKPVCTASNPITMHENTGVSTLKPDFHHYYAAKSKDAVNRSFRIRDSFNFGSGTDLISLLILFFLWLFLFLLGPHFKKA